MDGRMRSVDAKAKYTWGRGANVTNIPNPFTDTVPLARCGCANGVNLGVWG